MVIFHSFFDVYQMVSANSHNLCIGLPRWEPSCGMIDLGEKVSWVGHL